MIEEFAYLLPLDRIRDGDRLEISASESERRQIAERLGLEGLERFEASATLSHAGDSVHARGRLKAVVRQRCVVTGDPVPAHVDEPFDLMFVAEPTGQSADAEIELRGKDCDVVFHDGAAIDFGSAVADTLALSLDPYPRSAGAEAALKEAGVVSEEQAGPFAALAQLRKGMGQPDS